MILQLENVNKAYIQGKQSVHILHDINLAVEEGTTLPLWAPPVPAKPL